MNYKSRLEKSLNIHWFFFLFPQLKKLTLFRKNEVYISTWYVYKFYKDFIENLKKNLKKVR